MKRIGITGGIGSGKTTVSRIFETLGIPVYYADSEAKQLMQKDGHMITQIKEIFGDEIYNKKDELNKEKLSEIVFNDKEKLEQLNKLVHPAVKDDFDKWADRQKDIPYCILEAALIFEVGRDKDLDKVIAITAPEALRIKRIIERDNTSETAVKARIKNQLPEEEKVNKADYVINNDGDKMILPQAVNINTKLTA